MDRRHTLEGGTTSRHPGAFDGTSIASLSKVVIGLGLMAFLTLFALTVTAVNQAPGLEHRGLPSTRGDPTISAIASSDSELTGTCDPITVTVNFHSTVTGGTPPYSYSWDFGDNGTSRDSDPRHTYAVMFVEFRVLLRVTDANGALATNSTEFRGVPPPCAPSVGRIPPAVVLVFGGLGITVVAVAAVGFWVLRPPRRSHRNR